MSDNPQCEQMTWKGERCTRSGVKADSASRWDCGGSHAAPDCRVKIARNGPCACGSGKKAKKCCLPLMQVAQGVASRILHPPPPEKERALRTPSATALLATALALSAPLPTRR